MEQFIGNIDAKVDAKGRVSLPAVFRRVLQQQVNQELVLRPDIFNDCLVLYSLPAWEDELARMDERLDEYDEEQRNFREFFVSEAAVLELDSIGRVLLPKRAMAAAGITTDVRFIGAGDKIKLWSAAHFDSFDRKNRATFKENARRFLAKKDCHQVE